MSQQVIRRFVADLIDQVEMPEPVVEFGSMQVEAEQDGDLRPLFGSRQFIGSDMRPGPGVDRVEDLRSLSFEDGEIGTTICLDTLEHCEDPPQACRELHRVTAHGGICVISSVMLFGIHGYPNDYFRFTPEGFRSMLSGFDSVDVAGIGDPAIPFQVVGVGLKGRDLNFKLDELPSLADAQQRWEAAEGLVRIGPMRFSPRSLAQIWASEVRRNIASRTRRRGPGAD